MDVDFPGRPRFIKVKKRHKALLKIDEAHSIGVLGRNGRVLASILTSLAATSEIATRLRFFITSLHTSEQIRYTIDVLAEELEKMRLHGGISGDDTIVPDGKGVPGDNEPRNSKSLSSSNPVTR